MKTATAFSCALGLACSIALHAQSPTSSATKIVTVGCVNRAHNDGSLAGSPGVPPAAPNTAPAAANSAEPTGQLLLNGATSPDMNQEERQEIGTSGKSVPDSVTYVLEGPPAELEKHLGHRVEVTGALTIKEEGPNGAKNRVRHLQVASVRTIADKCPAER